MIEDIDERIAALRGAFHLADELLVVSAMLANQDEAKGIPYGDGVITGRNTFQKYYTQNELKEFISETLSDEAIAVGPGVFFVFKDKGAEQRFMYGRLESRRNIFRLAHLSRPDRPKRRSSIEERYNQHHELLESLWETHLMLGRPPDRSEIPNLDEIEEHFGSLSGAIRFIKSHKENPETYLDAARSSRIDDLQVYFAKLQFEKRKPHSHLDKRLQRDIRQFFGDYKGAVEAGRDLLYSIGKIDEIYAACVEAAENGLGWLEENASLQLYTKLVEQLPPLLRTYVHCGTHLYGDVTSADLIKIHIRSGKLTLMSFDDFEGKALPKMTQRIKLNLRNQDLEVFDYVSPFPAPYLYRKSRFINEEDPNYVGQIAIEEKLETLNLLNFEGYGPSAEMFDQLLNERRYFVDGYQIQRTQTIPNLDEPCGKYLTYRHLIECGETYAQTGIPNIPKEPDTYSALLDLATHLLDPIIDYYGMIKLTYGFSSPALSKAISKRIAPALDQHAAYEKKRNGKFICERLGAACDFIVEDENMEEVIAWIAENLDYDRIYFISDQRPIHLSFGPQRTRQITQLVPGPSGRLVPRVIRNRQH